MSEASLQALSDGRKLRWPSFEDRFEANVERTDGCWFWRGRSIRGYGAIERDGVNVMAHRVAFEVQNGAIPPGRQIDHICHNRSCVRPSHLRLATNKENCENKDLTVSNKSGYRGVSRYRDGVRWVAQVKHHQRTIYLGLFDTADEAAEAARRKRLDLFTHNDADHAPAGRRVWPEVSDA